jgi:hypothetical protein
MHYCPFRHFRQLCIATKLTFVRLACLIHAANVRSEPGSNPSKVIRLFQLRLTTLPFGSRLNGIDVYRIGFRNRF